MRFVGGVVLSAILAGSGWAGELRVGVADDYRPFNFVGKDGELQGFDVDIAVALCKRLGVPCRFVRQEPVRRALSPRPGSRRTCPRPFSGSTAARMIFCGISAPTSWTQCSVTSRASTPASRTVPA